MFKRILVANRGEIALRIFRACRELGVETVAIFSEADRGAAYLNLANEAYCVGPAKAADSYLKIDRVISAAEIGNVQAIHPGYGFWPRTRTSPRSAGAARSSSSAPRTRRWAWWATRTPCAAWPRKSACPPCPAARAWWRAKARPISLRTQLGFPVLIKAAAGGGGRGMRVALNDLALKSAIQQAQAEAEAAFGSGDIYLEKYIENPRHVEVQVLADNHGHVVHLWERDCTLQRRHQKLIEESPAPRLDADTRQAMCEIAVRIVQAANYTNAGTVEFIVDRSGRHYFIEMNARIQVEHPVTEMVTGIDLIKAQILVAAGEELPFRQEEIRQTGVVLECRINAEDPEKHFRPTPGAISKLRIPGGFGVRFDSHVHEGYTVSQYYDSMIGKLIVHQPTRPEAVACMKRCAVRAACGRREDDDPPILENPRSLRLQRRASRYDVHRTHVAELSGAGRETPGLTTKDWQRRTEFYGAFYEQYPFPTTGVDVEHPPRGHPLCRRAGAGRQRRHLHGGRFLPAKQHRRVRHSSWILAPDGVSRRSSDGRGPRFHPHHPPHPSPHPQQPGDSHRHGAGQPGQECLGSRALKDAKRTAPLKTVYDALRSMGVDALISIGGDDTLKTANKFKLFQEQLPPGHHHIPVVHLPKTIDNDYMGIDFTFGYFTAVEQLAGEIRNLLADAEANRSYFIAETMGRSAGWLAYGAAIAGEASLVISVEDITGNYEASETAANSEAGKTTIHRVIELEEVVRRIVATMRVREEAEGKEFGVIVIAEGLAEYLPFEHIEGIPRDEHGHIAVAKLNLSRLFSDLVAKEYTQQTGKKRKITGLQLGYECRCARPLAFDVMLGSQLGVAAYRALIEKRLDGVMVSASGQFDLNYVPFNQLVDPKTLVTVVRYIDPGSDFHRLARFWKATSVNRSDSLHATTTEHRNRAAAVASLSHRRRR